MGIEFLVLGPIEARRGGVPVPLGGAQQRRLLAILLSASGQMLSLDRLEETVWPNGDAPDGARRTLFTYVSRLRAALGEGHVVTRDAGYLLDAGPDALDSVSFEGLVGAARSAAPTLRVALLDQALGLWRGPAFGEFAGEWWAHPIAARLEELRLAANEDRIDALLDLGEADRAVSEAEGFAAAYPLRERPVAQLMRARLVTGRQAEALRAYHDFREHLREQTGLEPSPALVDLERSIAAGSAPEPPSTSRAARGYVLGDVLGQGSFGTVFRATQPGVGREVAVKVVRSELANNPTFVQRFEAEAQLVARLEHPHIVPLYDFWREPGGAYLVFRLMRGGSAEQSLATDGAWALDRVSSLVEQIGGALSAAHAAGVVHRDVKPANVLYDDSGNAHLADFGIAAADDSDDGGGLYSAGSPLYASPEQYQHIGVSARSDLYSFGAMVWELLAGVPPFEGESASTIARVKLERPVPSLARLRPDLAPTIDAVLQKATAVKPDDRFASAIELVLAWRAAVEAREAATTDGGIARASAMRQYAAQTMADLAIAATNPYKGLRPFAEADARDYFGRAALVEDLVCAVTSSRVTMVVGSSGSGKSSLLSAGLVPRLRTSGARVVTMMPTDRPCAQLHAALSSVAVAPLAPELEHAVEFVADESLNELVIVIDQFEEVWTLTSDVDERDRFVALLRRIAVDDSINVRLVFAIRADFFDRPLSEPELGSIVGRNVFSIAPMTAAELAEAVRAPANAAGVTFEPGLDAEIVADVVNQSASLPLLQFALAELYERRRGAVIPTVAYRELGGVAGAVAARAEALYGQLDEAGQLETRRLFSRLVTPGAGAEDTRRRARRSELPHTANVIADQFVAHRLLVVDRDSATREPTVDIAHEALLTRWPRLRSWLDEDREQLQLMQHLSRAADEWDEAGRRDSDLYRGPRLSIVGDISDAGNVILAPVEDDFLTASRSARAAEEQTEKDRIAQQARQNRRLRRALVGAGIMLVIAVLAGSVALVQRNRADDQRALAATQRDAAERAANDALAARDEADIQRMVAQSRADASEDGRRAMLLAVEAYRRRPDWQTAGAIQSVLAQQPKGILGHLTGDGPYAFVQVGAKVIVAMDGKSLSVWDAATWQKQRSIEIGEIVSVKLSADEQFVAVSDIAGVTVLSVATGERLSRLPFGLRPHVGGFDPTDTNRLAVVDQDGTVAIVRWRTNQSDVRFSVPSGGINAVFSNDGTTLVSSHFDGTIRFWNTRTGAELRPPLAAAPGGAYVFLSSFSPDGTMVASASVDGHTRVWRVADGGLVAPFDLPSSPSTVGVEFTDDRTILIQTGSGFLRFDLASSALLPGLASNSGDIALNSERTTLATASARGIEIRALDARQLGARASLPLPPGFAPVPSDELDRLSVDEHGTQLLAFDTQAYLYDLTNPRPTWRVVEFPGDGTLAAATFTRDGRSIMTVHRNPAAGSAAFQLWDPATLRPLGSPVRMPIGNANIAAFALTLSPDHRLVAWGYLDTGRTKSTVRVYDVATGAETQTLTDLNSVGSDGASEFAWSLSFSPDSKRLAVGTLLGGGAFVWDLSAPAPTPFVRIADSGWTVEFDPTGRFLVTVDGGSSLVTFLDASTLLPTNDPVTGRTAVRATADPSQPFVLTDGVCGPLDEALGYRDLALWDAEHAIEIGKGFNLNCGFWLPDGSGFVGKDLTSIQIWPFDQEAWKDAACRFAGRSLSESEWRRYGPTNKPYRATCG